MISTVGCVLVMQNAQQFIEQQIGSILTQSRPIDRLILIDDGSTDKSVQLAEKALANASFEWALIHADESGRDFGVLDRIGRNFATGVRELHTDIVVLSDHDDIWMPHRVQTQAEVLELTNAAMVAHNGLLIDGAGALIPGSLHERFPVPKGWDTMTTRQQIEEVVARPVATGAASSIAPARLFGKGRVPRGWLHDRWYSFDAVSQGRLSLSPNPIINYRVHETQAVGLTQPQTVREIWHDVHRKPMAVAISAWKVATQSTLGLRSEGKITSPLIFPRSAHIRHRRLSRTDCGGDDDS